MSCGRRLHDYWQEGGFTPTKRENARIGAVCDACGYILKNTSQLRLRSHRNVCNRSSHQICAKENKTVYVKPDNSESDSFSSQSQQTHLTISSATHIEEDPLMHSNSSRDAKDTFVISSIPVVATSSDPESDTKPSTMITQSSNKEFQSPKKIKHTIIPAVDNIDEKDTKEADTALAKFFFACNVPFSVVDSDFFKEFTKSLWASYKTPSSMVLGGKLLDEVYADIRKSNRITWSQEDAVLLIDGWKNSKNSTNNVLAVMKRQSGEKIFIHSFDFTKISETVEQLARVCERAVSICKESYKANIYAIVTDSNPKNMLKMHRHVKHQNVEIIHVACSSHTASLLVKDIANKSLTNNVIMIQTFFRNHASYEKLIVDYGGKCIVLPIKTRWCTYRDSFENFLFNLRFMQNLAVEEESDMKDEVTELIFDDIFKQKVEEEINLYDPICTLINKCQSDDTNLADAVELWLNLQVPDRFSSCLENRRNMALTIGALTSYQLHPLYRGEKLTTEQKSQVEIYLLEVLSAEELNDYSSFVSGEGIFGHLNKRCNKTGEGQLNPKTYWSFASRQHPGLSKYALRLLNIPAASTAIERVFPHLSFVDTRSRNGLSPEKSKMLMDIHYSLKISDSNKSEEY